MVLLGLGTTWGCTRWLHREDFVFELSDRKPDEASESTILKPEGQPSQYWLIGFKDRHLEREYLEDLVETSFFRLFVGTILAVALSMTFLVHNYANALVVLFALDKPPLQIAPYLVACVLTAIAFIGALVVLGLLRTHSSSKGGRRYSFFKGRKYIALYVIEAAYLLYIFGCIWSFVDGFDNQGFAVTFGMLPMAYWLVGLLLRGKLCR